MAIGRIRALIIIALFASSAAIPVIMETSVVPMINLLNFVDQFVQISYDQDGNPIKMDVKFDALLSSIKKLEVLADESSENQTVIQLTLTVKNMDLTFDMLFPGIDMTVYWKAGLPYEREKDTILGWKNAPLNSTNPHPEPVYDSRRWTRVLGIKIDATRIHPEGQKDLAIKLYLYNDEWDRGVSSALGQMLGTILRTQSTTDENGTALMHIGGSANLDIPGVNFGLSLDLGVDLSGILNLTQLLGGLGDTTGGTGGESNPNLFELLFDVPPNILDIQNYNDSNGNFLRDYSGIDNTTGQKRWTEDLYHNGAISAYLIMDLVNQLGLNNFNITLMKSSYNPDDADVGETWNPVLGSGPIFKNTTMNQIFLYIPDSPNLFDSSWANKIFGLFGFSSDQHLYDYPEQKNDLSDGRIIAGGTLRLTGDLRQNSNFSIGDGLGALITQAIKGILPIGIFGAVDLKLNKMPLSLCLDMPLEINLTSFLGMMGGEEGGGGDMFSMLLDYFGLKSILINGVAFDTLNSLLQLNITTDLDMFLPYGIYMPSEPEYNETTGKYTPYLGIGGGPIQIFNEKLPTDWENMTPQAQEDWEELHLIMNITSLDSDTLTESMAKLMADIGRTDQGEGLAYLFDDGLSSNGNHGDILQYLAKKGQLPTAKEDKSSFSFTADDFILSLEDIVPDFGAAIKDVAYQMGIDPLFIEYLNNSIPHDNAKSVLEDLLSIRQLLNLLNQEGPKNDIIDYLLDSRITYNETAQVLSANTIQTTYDGVKTINSISNGTHEWWNTQHDPKSFTENGLITVNTTAYNDSLLENGPIIVNYTTNKLHLLDVSKFLESLMNLVFGSSEGGTGGISSDLMTQVFTLLPGALDAMGMDLDRIMPDLITYLRVNLSQPVPKGYGIKPFEMLDVAYHALFSADTGQASSVFEGPSRDLIDNMIKEVVSMFVEQADPFQLGYALMGDLTPVLDYLNRSRLFSREVLIPLIASLFPSGAELQTGQEESISLEDIINIIMPLISEMLVGGDLAHFDHQALNPFALLSSAECIQYQEADPVHLAELASYGYPVYQVGYGNYTADYPRYDYLRLMSNLTLGLLMSGFDAQDLWTIINMLGIINLEGGGGSSDLLGGLKPLLSLLGTFVPPTEWDSLVRELGIWSCWEGDFQRFMAYITVIGITIPFNLADMVAGMINLEQLLATGQVLGGEFVQLCLYENQSYGNPYSYVPGYDSSYNTGPYRDFYYGTDDCDNWGWVPYGWDPGGYEYGTGPDYSPQKGADYPDSFIARLISTIPVEFDVDVLRMDPIDVTIGFDIRIWIFTIHIDVRIVMQFSPELFMRIRLEGNPSALTSIFEDEGVPLMGLASHFVGGDLAGLVTDMIDALTNPTPTAGQTTALPELDLLALLQSFLNAKVDLLDYFKFLVDPEFMKGSDWYLDSSFLDINASAPTLIWDDYPGLGDHDNIPDEYPWYRFNLPIYNQDPAWVNYGPSSPQGRTPKIIDQLTPAGPPGSGWWEIQPDGIPDGIQHYWYDTPYAYVNTTVRATDRWVTTNPYDWNNDGLPGGPLLKNKATGQGLPSQYWDATDFPSLYFVPRGTTPGFVGDVTYLRAPYTTNYPIPPFNTADRTPFPNIWQSFNITLNQTDYRFGYWSSYYDAVLGKNVNYLETKPFWDLLSYAFYPQLGDMLDLIAPMITDLIISMLVPSGTSGGYKGEWGYDYYHLLQNSSVYSKFGLDPYQPLCPLGMLEWLWEGAGQRWNGSQMVPYIEPYTIPNLQGGLDWLADHGFTIDFLIKNLDKIFKMFAIEQEGSGAVDLAGDLASIFSTDTIVNVVNSIEDYMLNVVAVNPDGTGNRTEATRIVLSMLKDMTKIMDIYPVKALRGALNYLMPRLTQTTGGDSGMPSLNQLDLGTFLEDSGLLDIIFYNFSKLGDLSFPISIHSSSIDLYLFGQKIEGIPLNIDFDLDLASLLGGGGGSDGKGGASGTDVLNDLPIAFPEGGFPYIELSTFNGPFNISFALYNTSLTGLQSPVRYTNVTIGEVWFNETSGVYIFNRTQSSYEYERGLSGWTNPDGKGIFRTYVRPNSLLRSDATGLVKYSSTIEPDDFGWVDPYIYIHVERPNEYQNQEFYWWNVTGHPVQKTLAGHTPPYKARWIEDGEDILVQSANTLPSSTINIDGDSYWEIFARVEIDGHNMPTHDVVYVSVGSVQSVSIANATGGANRIQINASHTETTDNWRIFAYTDQTKYILNQEITPTGKAVVYPTISQVISGFHLQTARWTDDSLYRLKVDYVNLTGSLVGIYDWKINRTAGDYQNNVMYPTAPAGFTWTLPGGNYKLLNMQFTPPVDAESYGNFKYSNINVDASSFIDKTIKSVNITLKVTKGPEPTGTANVKRYSEDFGYISPAPTTYYLHQNVMTDTVQIQGYNASGATNLNLMKATGAWVNITAPIPANAFLNSIDWYVRAAEAVNGSMSKSTTNVSQVVIEFYNQSSNKWLTLINYVAGTKQQVNIPQTVNVRYTGMPLWDWGNYRSGGLWFENGAGSYEQIGMTHELYMTSRNQTSFESITKVKFAVYLRESPSGIFPNDGLGYQLGYRSYNSSVSVAFRFYPFVSSWGLGAIEIPEGFVSNFVIALQMYDPLLDIDNMAVQDRPNVSITYDRLGPLNTGATVNFETGVPAGQTFFARKVLVYLEAWDSLTRENGAHGDILFKDNQSAGPIKLVYLSPLNFPSLNTTIEVVDLEAKMYINVTIPAGQTLRNYYLKMNITPSLGYETTGYTSNYRFSVGTDTVGGDTEAISKIGAYPSKKILKTNSYGFPTSLQVGIVDLDPFNQLYHLCYILTFDVSPQFLMNATARERFYFSAVWEKASGSYEVRSDKMETAPAQVIAITFR